MSEKIMREDAPPAQIITEQAVVFALQTLHRAQPVVHKLIYVAAATFTLLCFLGV